MELITFALSLCTYSALFIIYLEQQMGNILTVTSVS